MRFGKLLLLGLFLYPLFVFSSDYSRSKWIGTEYGLNNATVHELFCGEKSFLWLTTDAGLSRYDGHHFRNFPLPLLVDATVSCGSGEIRSICGSGDGLLFLLLAQGGIACFDVKTEQYLPVNFDVSFDKTEITSLFVADGSQLYIGTITGLYSAEVKTSDANGIAQLMLSLSKPILTGSVSKITSDGMENLFLCINDSRILQYSMGTQQTKEVELATGNPLLNIADISVCKVFGDYMIICGQHGILCYDYKREVSRPLQSMVEVGAAKLSDTSVTGITSADGQVFYLSTLNGVYRIRFDAKDLIKASFNIECVSEGRRMSDVLWDASHQTLWVSSYGGGIERIGAETQGARRISLTETMGTTGIQQDAQGVIWLAAYKKGIWKSTSPALSSDVRFESWQGADGQQSHCIYKDKNNGLWFGNEKAEIIHVEPSGQTSTIRLAPGGVTNFMASIKSIYLDKRDRLWAVTSKGLVLLDRKTGNCSMPLNGDNAALNIYSIVEDNKENIWVGTGNGVKRLNMLPGKTELVGDFEKQAGGNPVAAYVLYMDADNILWVAYADKVMRINAQTEQLVSVLDMSHKLKNGRVNSMAADQKGNIWMACNSGVCVAQKGGSVVYNSPMSDYVQSVACLRNGAVLYGGTQDLLYYAVEPERQTGDNLVLSDVWVNGKSIAVGEDVFGQVVLETAPQLQKQLAFGSGSSSIALYFTDLSFGEGSQPVAYRLLPDEEWRMGTLEEGIAYDGLTDGSYTLQVKLVYPTGEGAVLELPIEVRTAWWASSWMHLAYGILILALLIGAYFYFCKKGALKGSIKSSPKDSGSPLAVHGTEGTRLSACSDEQQDKNKRADYAVMNLFLLRFMQELRTPLSVTKVLLKEVANHKGLLPEMSSKLLISYRNSVGVLNACELLLEVYRQEATGSHLSVAAYSPVKLIDSLIFSMSEFLKVYSVQLNFKKAEVLDDVWIDRSKIEFLLHNLLSNAFIHIRYVGRISLSVSQVVEDGKTYCVIEVGDDGNCTVKTLEEMTEAELLGDESVTTELGLDVMQKIVRLHHGSLVLNNDAKVGTTLTLKLPTDKDVFANDPEVTFVEAEDLNVKEDAEAKVEVALNAEDEKRLLMQDSAHPAKEQNDRNTILIIEDYPDIRLYLKVLFEKEYNVLLATNGVEGVELAQKEIPDLIICDIMMPLKDGYECCKDIKEGLDTCHIPFIMLTAKIEDEDVVKGLETGADDYILKPFTPSILKARVKSLIQGRVNLKQMYANLLTTPMTEAEVSLEGEGETNVEDPFISMVIKIIEENIQEPDFSVKKLAFDLNMSQPTLYRKVKQYTDFTIIELIRGVRLRKAATLLKQKCYAVQEVAEMVGYNDVPTFRKHFVDMFGTTPSTYASGGNSAKDKSIE